jgi:hypothetical protein
MFSGASNPDDPFYPGTFDAIISFNDLDPSMQVRSHVLANTTGTAHNDPDTGLLIIDSPATFTVENYTNYVTAGAIPSISPTVGAKFYMIKEASGLWWGDKDPNVERWPSFPNDF